MYKKCLLVLAAMLLAAAMIGCQCSGNVTTPSPGPTTTGNVPSILPSLSASPDLSASPGLSTSPDLSTSPGVSTSPDGGSATIPDFTAGKEVDEKEVPEIVEAIREQFKDGEIKSIKHATQDEKQVYAVEVKTGSTTQTVYVLPDGTLLPNGGNGNGNNGGTSGNGSGGNGSGNS